MSNWFMNIVTITGANIDNAGNPFFWGTPAGFVTMLVIMVCALIAIFSHRAKSDAFTVIYNWVLVTVLSIAMIHIYENSNPKHQLQILLFALAMKKLWDTIKLFSKK